jgi:hypothetical protein
MSDQLQKRIGLGFMLQCDDVDGVNFTNLAHLVDGFEHTGAKATMANVSLLADVWDTFTKANIDPGEITLTVACDPRTNTTYSRLAGLLAKTGINNVNNFRILYPVAGSDNNTHTETSQGFVSQLGRKIQKGALVVAPATLKLSDNPNMGNAS